VKYFFNKFTRQKQNYAPFSSFVARWSITRWFGDVGAMIRSRRRYIYPILLREDLVCTKCWWLHVIQRPCTLNKLAAKTHQQHKDRHHFSIRKASHPPPEEHDRDQTRMCVSNSHLPKDGTVLGS
jgi:hypothetical protein